MNPSQFDRYPDDEDSDQRPNWREDGRWSNQDRAMRGYDGGRGPYGPNDVRGGQWQHGTNDFTEREGRYWQQNRGHDGRQDRMGSGRFSGPQMNEGPHTGKGPKGYQRSDERIHDAISEHLTQHPEIDCSEIEINVRNGVVTVTGSVEDRQSKHLLEDELEGVYGVKDVNFQVRVQKGGENGKTQTSQEGSSSSKGSSKQLEKR